MKTLVIYSGGMDSFTLLNLAIEIGDEVQAVTFDYGQRHKKEIDYAKRNCLDLGIPHYVLPVHLPVTSALTSGKDVPHGHYEDESMRDTVVPNRNMILLSLAASVAIDRNLDRLAYGAHAGDHAIYPDCRPAFVSAMNVALKHCDYKPLYVWTPFLHMSKRGIAQEGHRMGLDYSKSWTCYEGGDEPCGACGACVERAEALV